MLSAPYVLACTLMGSWGREWCRAGWGEDSDEKGIIGSELTLTNDICRCCRMFVLVSIAQSFSIGSTHPIQIRCLFMFLRSTIFANNLTRVDIKSFHIIFQSTWCSLKILCDLTNNKLQSKSHHQKHIIRCTTSIAMQLLQQPQRKCSGCHVLSKASI